MTVPSISPSTLNSCAISGNGFSVFLYRMTDVNEITGRVLILARAPISASVPGAGLGTSSLAGTN